jgi:hypothetical protein
MHFEESFFQSSSGSEDDECTVSPHKTAEVIYSAKRCELKVRKGAPS